jgi:outer membrane biosynthesis protein TonB
VRTRRFGDLEEHELIHLIDTLDDERSRARFRESIYISIIIWLAIGWFLFYGPRVLFHVPQYRDPIALMKQHDQDLTLNLPPAPHAPKIQPKIDNKTMERLQKQAREAPPTPQPPTPQPEQPPQQEARNTAPPVQQAPMPLPAAPKPSPSIESPLPAAPKPSFAQNSQTPGDAMRNAARGSMGRSGADIAAPSTGGPLGAGVQVLSDTQGVDFSAYLRRLLSDTKRNWEPLIPEEAQPPLLKKGITWIRFTILPGGEIAAMTLEGPSGDVALDRAAWNSITSEGQYPPLPKEFHGPNFTLRLGFYCNTPLPQ